MLQPFGGQYFRYTLKRRVPHLQETKQRNHRVIGRHVWPSFRNRRHVGHQRGRLLLQEHRRFGAALPNRFDQQPSRAHVQNGPYGVGFHESDVGQSRGRQQQRLRGLRSLHQVCENNVTSLDTAKSHITHAKYYNYCSNCNTIHILFQYARTYMSTTIR